MPPLRDLRGMVFNRLTVLDRAGSDAGGCALWSCSCACGGSATVRGASLTSGRTTSDGCRYRERGRTLPVRRPRPRPQPRPPAAHPLAQADDREAAYVRVCPEHLGRLRVSARGVLACPAGGERPSTWLVVEQATGHAIALCSTLAG